MDFKKERRQKEHMGNFKRYKNVQKHILKNDKKEHKRSDLKAKT